MTNVSKHRDGMGIERDAAIESYIQNSVDWYLSRANRKPGKMIDVGCNYGFAMLLMQNAGWTTMGIDIEPQYLLKDLTIFNYPMESLIGFVLLHKFVPDLFFFNHSLEHSKTPWAVLEAAHAMLPQGGDVFIAFPDPSSKEYVAAGHNSIFSEPFMRFMLTEIGLEEVASRVTTMRKGHTEVQFIGRKR